MKPCSSNYANVSRRHRDGLNCANELRWSMLSPMSVSGKGNGLDIALCARISSICVDLLVCIICMSWLVPSIFPLSFKTPLDFLTDALGLLLRSSLIRIKR